MSNPDHLKILKEGVEKWNKWREKNPEIKPDLSKADLRGANLREADLSGSVLTKADLRGADLSEAIVDKFTLDFAKGIKGIKGALVQVGVNGIWSKSPDSAALMTLTPPGDSMQGSNPIAIIESLKRARRLHGFSLALIGILLLIYVLGLKEIEFPYVKNLKLASERFGLLAIPISIGLLSLVNTFMADALKGARYLNDRKSAMIVGNFPWSLSKYTGSDFIKQLLSLFTRLAMSFHPLAYLYYITFIYSKKWGMFNITILFLSLMLLLVFSIWTFLISEQFQKPIFFDRETEKKRMDDFDKLPETVAKQTGSIIEQTDSIRNQTSSIRELTELLKPKQDRKTIEDSGTG